MHSKLYRQFSDSIKKHKAIAEWIPDVSLDHLVRWTISAAIQLKKSQHQFDTLSNHLERRMENNLIVQLFGDDIYEDVLITSIKYLNDNIESGTTFGAV